MTETLMDTAPARQGDDPIKLAARVNCPVLITADSVEQREAVARLIHQEGRFVKVDCATIDDSVFDDTIVGTLFIDLIDTMGSSMQTRLSLFLEQQAMRRTSHSTPGLPRIITGSDGSVMRRIAANQFNENLFYRLNLIHIEASELRMGFGTA
jgi:DNA-binding NtrC family response regulator